MPGSTTSRALEPFDYSCLAAFVGFKFALLLAAVPASQPDTSSYLALAAGFVDGAPWIETLTWSGLPPNEIGRSAGYPLFMAALTHLFGEPRYQVASLWIQSAGTSVAFIMAYRVHKALAPGRAGLLLLTVLAATSLMMLYDLSLLTDSSSATLVAVPILAFAGHALGVWRLGPVAIIGLGMLWGWGVLVRPPNLYFTVLPIGAIVALWWIERRGIEAILATLILFLAPVMLQTGAHVAWNSERAGVAALTTNGVKNWLWPLFNMRDTGLINPFAAGDEVDRAAVEASAGKRNYQRITATLDVLIEQYDGDWRALDRRLREKWIGAAREHPVVYARTVIRTIDLPRTAFVLFEPRRNLRALVNGGAFGAALGPVAGGRELRATARTTPGLATIGALGVLYAGRLFALVMFVVLALGVPVATVRSWRRGERHAAFALGLCWLSVATVLGAYGLIHLEDRMLAPVVLPALLASCAALGRAGHEWRRRDRGGLDES